MKNFEDIDKKAIEMYSNNISITKIAKELNTDRGSLSIRLKKKGIAIINDNGRKYNVDHFFFNKIDNEHKAYWLGFLYADGNVSKINGGNYENKFIIELSLQESDKNHIEKFLYDLNSDYKIYSKRVPLGKKIHDSCRIFIYSKQMHSDLIKFGCAPNKTFKLRFPHIDKNLVRHFIRGFFDGDGCFHWNNKVSNINKISFSSGCDIFLSDLKEILKIEAGLDFRLSRHPSCFSLCISGNQNIKAFADYIYNESTIHLDRKYEKYANCRLNSKLLKS